MKAMCQAAWLLTVAGGNFIVLIIAESSAFENRVRTHWYPQSRVEIKLCP